MNVSWQLFRFPLDDERWKNKAVIGMLLGLVSVFFWPLILPLMGMGVRVMRQTVKGESPSLPEWDDWGGLFSDGLCFWVVQLVYALPAYLPMCCAFAFFVLAFLPAAAAEQAQAPPAIGILGVVGAYGVGFIVMGVALVLALFLGFLALVALTRWVATGSLSSAFEFGEVWRLTRAGAGNFLLAYAIWYGGLIVASTLATVLIYTIILACLYPFVFGVLMLYSNLLMGAVFGMAYYHTQANLPAAEEKALPA